MKRLRSISFSSMKDRSRSRSRKIFLAIGIVFIVLGFILYLLIKKNLDQTIANNAIDAGVDIEFLNLKDEDASIMMELINLYRQRNEDINVVLNIRSDAEAIINKGIIRRELPDILAIRGDALFSELIESGLIMDMTETGLSENIESSYITIAKDLNPDSNSKLYGIPYVTTINGIIYNEDIFNEAGLQIPDNWDSFIEVCEALKNTGIVPLVYTLQDAWTTNQSWQALVNNVNNYEAEEMVNTEGRFLGVYEDVLRKCLQLVSYANDDYLLASYRDGLSKMAQEEAAMIIMGGWAINEILELNPRVNLGMMPFPNDSQVVNTGIDVVFLVSDNSDFKDESVQFIKFLLEKDIAKMYIDDQYAFSTVKGVEQDNPVFELVSEHLILGKTSPFPESYYPNDFDYPQILSEFYINNAKGINPEKNISDTLLALDELFEAVR